MTPEPHSALPTYAELVNAVDRLWHYVVMSKFEPDAGTPHPMPEYNYDRVVALGRDILARAKEQAPT